MKNVIIFLCCVLIWGCAGKPAPIKQEIRITQDRQATEMSAEQVAQNKDYTYQKIEGQDNIPILERSVLLIKKDGSIIPVSIQELYGFITFSRTKLYQIIMTYNYLIDRLVEIHEHPNLDIDLTEIPEKANIRWFIPVDYR